MISRRELELDLSLMFLDMQRQNVVWTNATFDWLVNEYIDHSWGVSIQTNNDQEIHSNVRFGDRFSAHRYLDELEARLVELVRKGNGKVISIDLN